MSIGYENFFSNICGLLVIVSVIFIILFFWRPTWFQALLFKGEPLQNASREESPAVHDFVMDAARNMAKTKLDIVARGSPKNDIQEIIEKKEGEYGHLSNTGKALHSQSYTDDVLTNNIYQHIDSSKPVTSGAEAKVNHLNRELKLAHYNYDSASAIASHAPAYSDKSSSLGSNSKFGSLYSQNRTPFIKGQGHMQEAVGAAPSVIV